MIRFIYFRSSGDLLRRGTLQRRGERELFRQLLIGVKNFSSEGENANLNRIPHEVKQNIGKSLGFTNLDKFLKVFSKKPISIKAAKRNNAAASAPAKDNAGIQSKTQTNVRFIRRQCIDCLFCVNFFLSQVPVFLWRHAMCTLATETKPVSGTAGES